MRSPLSLGRRVDWFCVLSSYLIIAPTSKQAVALSEPNFWTHFLEIHCNGFAGPRSCLSLDLVWKPRPYNWRCLWEGCSCDDECNDLLRQDQIPSGRLWWPVYCTTKGELLGGSQLNGPLAPCVWPSPPPGVRPPRISWPAPLGLDWERRQPCEALQGGSAAGLVLKDRYWCLLTHWNGWMGLQQWRVLGRQNQGLAQSSNLSLWEN